MLQNNFRKPDKVRVFGIAPGKVTLICVIPFDKGFAKGRSVLFFGWHIRDAKEFKIVATDYEIENAVSSSVVEKFNYGFSTTLEVTVCILICLLGYFPV